MERVAGNDLPAEAGLLDASEQRQLSGEAVQGIDQIVRIFNPDAVAEEERPAPVRQWTGAGSRPAALVTIDGADWRVKETGDSGLSAMEASLSRMFQLTGLAAPDARVVAVHMEAINHCLLTRADLHQRVHEEHLHDHVTVLEDGAEVPLP